MSSSARWSRRVVGSGPGVGAATAGVVLRRARHGAALLAFLGTAACDSSFEPTAESDRALSVFGYLDASQDTQWIRVLPLRPLVFTSPESPGLEVALEELGSGRILPLRDSVFEYPRNPDLNSEGVFTHNYWTAEKIQPGATYRFTATGPDGASSDAEIPIPQDYSVTVVINTSPSAPGNLANNQRYDAVRIVGVENLAFVRVLMHMRNSCGPYVYPIDYRIPRLPDRLPDPRGKLRPAHHPGP
jgi:hypothetical protein